MLEAAVLVELWELEFAFMADLIHWHKETESKMYETWGKE